MDVIVDGRVGLYYIKHGFCIRSVSVITRQLFYFALFHESQFQRGKVSWWVRVSGNLLSLGGSLKFRLWQLPVMPSVSWPQSDIRSWVTSSRMGPSPPLALCPLHTQKQLNWPTTSKTWSKLPASLHFWALLPWSPFLGYFTTTLDPMLTTHPETSCQAMITYQLEF